MKRFAFPLIVLSLIAPAQSPAQPPDPARLLGRWSGQGTFDGKELQQQVGAISFDVHVDDAQTGTGRIGGATLADVRVRPVRDVIEVKARLHGAVGAGKAGAKGHVVLVVTTVTDSSLHGEFHLKSNVRFDPRMLEGRIVLSRLP